jgi:putative endonuclease
LKTYNYYVYILTNLNKKVLYIGVTNSISRRIFEHKQDANGPKITFAGKYNCTNVIYFEHFQFIDEAIKREKELKSWNRKKKEKLITSSNPNWEFLEIDF